MRCEAGDEGGQLIGWYVQSQSKYFLFKINKRNMIYLSNLYKSEMYLYQCAVHQNILHVIVYWMFGMVHHFTLNSHLVHSQSRLNL